MSLKVSGSNVQTTQDFDVFTRTSEIDFLSLYGSHEADEFDKPFDENRDPPQLFNKPFEDSLIYSDFDRGPELADWRNRSELGDSVSVSSLGGSDSWQSEDNLEPEEDQEEEEEEEEFVESGTEFPGAAGTPFGQLERERTLDDLFKKLESVTCDETQSEKVPEAEVGGAKSEWSEDADSLLDFSDREQTTEVRVLEDDTLPLPQTPIADLTMSYEARSAILQTLRDMTNSELKSSQKYNHGSGTDSIRNKGVTVQKRIRENRNKYDNYKRMFETGTSASVGPSSAVGFRRQTSIGIRRQSARCKTLDSEGGTAHDGNSSELSDDSCCDAEEKRKLARLPFLSSKKSGGLRPASSGTNVYSLEDAKVHKYRLPGIGKFDIMVEERDFEITPPGFDSRYNPRPIITKEEMEEPPRNIKAQSVKKCKRWLKNVNIYPMSLHPSQK